MLYGILHQNDTGGPFMTHSPEETLHAVPLETLLEQGNILKIKPQGYSMYPLFIPGRDEALIEQVPTTQLKRGDVVLYRRRHGILVLHRICRITPAGYYMVGDNQYETEGPLSAEQIHGKLIGVIRNGHSFSVVHPLYRFLSMLWLNLLPLRPLCFRISAFLKKLR